MTLTLILAEFTPAEFTPAEFTLAEFTPAEFTLAEFSLAEFTLAEIFCILAEFIPILVNLINFPSQIYTVPYFTLLVTLAEITPVLDHVTPCPSRI